MTTMEKLEKLIYEGFKDTDRKFQETVLEIEKVNRQVENINSGDRQIFLFYEEKFFPIESSDFFYYY